MQSGQWLITDAEGIEPENRETVLEKLRMLEARWNGCPFDKMMAQLCDVMDADPVLVINGIRKQFREAKGHDAAREQLAELSLFAAALFGAARIRGAGFHLEY